MNNKQVRMINTSLGEVMLKQCFDVDTQESFCDMYIGDNYDEYVGEIECSIYDDEETILQQIEEYFKGEH